MKVVDRAVADAEEEGEEEKKVVTNPFDTGLDQLSKRENLIDHLRKVRKNDSVAVARDLANIDRRVNKAEADNKVNKRAPKKKRKADKPPWRRMRRPVKTPRRRRSRRKQPPRTRSRLHLRLFSGPLHLALHLFLQLVLPQSTLLGSRRGACHP